MIRTLFYAEVVMDKHGTHQNVKTYNRTTQKTKGMRKTDPTRKTGGEPMCWRRVENVKTYNRTTQKTKRMGKTDPTRKTGGEPMCWRRVVSSCFLYNTRRVTHIYSQEEFEDTIGAIRIRISKNRQHKEKVQKDKQRSTKHTYKTKDRVTRTPLITGGELRCSGRVVIEERKRLCKK